MSHLIDLDLVRQRRALDAWHRDCKRRFAQRYPAIDFESNEWPLRTLYGTDISDFLLATALMDFKGKDASFSDALRCLAAERVLEEKNKVISSAVRSFRLLHTADVPTLFDVDQVSLRAIENQLLDTARHKPSTSKLALESLQDLCRTVDLLSSKEVLPNLSFNIQNETRNVLLALRDSSRKRWRESRASLLDARIEALSEAFNALFSDDARLMGADRVALAMMGLEMCAPSRVNEILCMSIDDHVTIDDYAQRADHKDTDSLHAVHQMLLITVKGSKGAQWSPKPVLSFMISFFHYCIDVIKAHGTRSRMLVSWYREHPNSLYLPPELEHLRGTDISRRDIVKILYLDASKRLTSKGLTGAGELVFAALKHTIRKVPNQGAGTKAHKMVDALPWTALEEYLLHKARAAMAKCRAVTRLNHYKGDLSKMLFLCDYTDNNYQPYLPSAANFVRLGARLKRAPKSITKSPTLFARLGITIPVNGTIQIAEIDTHDPRRWLTTMALRYGEKLSNVLINKWANRLSLSQLEAYNYLPQEETADASAMPDVNELQDLTKGLAATQRISAATGFTPEIVTVHDAGISVTSMEAICKAAESRPVARTAEQIIVLYPSWFGICTHQHHETPCRAYSSCMPCDKNAVIKGHLPTNDRVRQRRDTLHRAIVSELEHLIVAHNRGIADDDQNLGHHILALAEKGLDPDEMADWLVDSFHEIKDQLRDVCFKNQLEEAFVSKGFALRLDDPTVPNGAHIKYHNPSRHAAPGLERALDTHGGREAAEKTLDAYFKIYPQFAPQKLGLKDQRELLPFDHSMDGERAGDSDE